MRRSVIAACAFATLAATGSTSWAAPPTSADTPCSLSTITVTGQPLSGALSGGPVAQTGTLTCTVQTANRHSDPDVLSRTAPGVGTTVLAPTAVSFTHPPTTQMYVCSSFFDGLGTYYYDNRTGTWGTSTAALCVPVTNVDTTPLMEVTDFWPGFPPAGFAVTSVGFVMTPGSNVPAFTPPPAGSHPANWTCAVSYSMVTKIGQAECSPVAGQEDPGFTGWACYDPFVDVTVANSPGNTGDSVTGTSKCGLTVADCTATTSARQPSAHCSEAAFPAQPVPFHCIADFSQATSDRTTTVRCSTIDP